MIKADIWMDFLIDDEMKYWFINGEGEALFYIDKETNITHYACELPDKKGNRLYNSGLKYKNKLWFMPFKADHILIYDISINSFEQIKLLNSYEGKAQFSICLNHENMAFAIDSYLKHVVLKINLDTKEIEEISFSKYVEESDILSRDTVLIGNKLYLTTIHNPVVLEINLDDNLVKKYVLGKTKQGFGTIARSEYDFILTNKMGIFKWNINEREAKIFKEYPQYAKCYCTGKLINLDMEKENLGEKQPFWKSHICNRKILLISGFINCSVLFDPITCELEAIDLGEEESGETLKELPLDARVTSLKHLFSQHLDDEILCYLTRCNSILKIDAECPGKMYSEFQTIMYRNEYYSFLSKRIHSIHETWNFGIKDLIEYIKNTL